MSSVMRDSRDGSWVSDTWLDEAGRCCVGRDFAEMTSSLVRRVAVRA